MVRGLRKETYYIAFLITAGIFLLGLLLGLVIDGERADFIQEEYQKQKITFKKAVEYVNTMDTALLMYCMNMDYRKNEHTKEVLETLSFNKQPESTVPQ